MTCLRRLAVILFIKQVTIATIQPALVLITQKRIVNQGDAKLFSHNFFKLYKKLHLITLILTAHYLFLKAHSFPQASLSEN